MKTSSDAIHARFLRLAAARRALSSILAALAVLAFVMPSSATALSLDELRAQGTVGERYDGYAVVRTAPPPAGAAAFVEQVNAQRQKIYEQRAAQQGVPAGQVGRVYAKQLYQELPAGTWFLDEAGRWVQK